MGKTFYCLLAAVLWGLAPAGAVAEVYKWVDENGRVVYSQSPPPEGDATQVKTRKTHISDEAAQEQLKSLTEKADNRQKNRELVAGTEQQSDEAAERRRQNCKQARANLKVLNESGRVRATGADGNPFYLSDENKQKKLAETQAQVKEFCD